MKAIPKIFDKEKIDCYGAYILDEKNKKIKKNAIFKLTDVEI